MQNFINDFNNHFINKQPGPITYGNLTLFHARKMDQIDIKQYEFRVSAQKPYAGRIVCYYLAFRSISDYKICITWLLEAGCKPTFNEFIDNSQTSLGTKFFLDIDGKFKTEQQLNNIKHAFCKYIDLLVHPINELTNKNFKDFDDLNPVMHSAHASDKFSLHVTFNIDGYDFPLEVQKYIIDQFFNEIKATTENESDFYFEKLMKKIIDTAPYGKNKTMRTFGSYKLTSTGPVRQLGHRNIGKFDKLCNDSLINFHKPNYVESVQLPLSIRKELDKQNKAKESIKHPMDEIEEEDLDLLREYITECFDMVKKEHMDTFWLHNTIWKFASNMTPYFGAEEAHEIFVEEYTRVFGTYKQSWTVDRFAYEYNANYNINCWSQSAELKDLKLPIFNIMERRASQALPLDINQFLFTSSTEINAEKLDSKIFAEHIESQDKLMCVESGCGTGKTYSLFGAIPEGKSVLFISHRKELSRSTAAKYDLQFYADVSDFSNVDRLCCQVESLYKLRGKTFDYLILDESDQLLHQFVARTISVPAKTEMVVKNLISEASKIFALSASMTPFTTQVLAKFGLTLDRHVRNTYKSINKCINILRTEECLQRVALEKIKNATGRVFMPYSSRADALKMKTLIAKEFPEKKVMCYTATSSDEDRKDLIDVNKNWQKYDVIIFNTVIEAGISYENLDAECIIAHFNNQLVSADACFQQLFRVRQDVPIYIYFQKSKGALGNYNEEVELKRLQGCKEITRSMFGHLSFMSEVKPDDPYVYLQIWSNIYKAYMRDYQLYVVKHFLKRYGATFNYVPYMMYKKTKITKTEAFADDWKNEDNISLIRNMMSDISGSKDEITNDQIEARYAGEHPKDVIDKLYRQAIVEDEKRLRFECEKYSHAKTTDERSPQLIMTRRIIDKIGHEKLSKDQLFDKLKECYREYLAEINDAFAIRKGRRLKLGKLDEYSFKKIKMGINSILKKSNYYFATDKEGKKMFYTLTV